MITFGRWWTLTGSLGGELRRMKLATRFRIVGVEVVGLGAFILLLLILELDEMNSNPTVASFGWVFALIGIRMLLVGFETLSLTRRP